MRLTVALSSVSWLAAGVLADILVPETHVAHERRAEHLEKSWTRHSKAPSTARLPMRIGLKQPNVQKGHDLLMNM